MQLVTHQTGPEGQSGRRLLIEEGADIKKELYVSMVVDRVSQARGADGVQRRRHGHRGSRRHHPEKIHKVFIDPSVGLTEAMPTTSPRKIGVPESIDPSSPRPAARPVQGVRRNRCIAG
jgi:succinyl-CoA synthetase beta subunit